MIDEKIKRKQRIDLNCTLIINLAVVKSSHVESVLMRRMKLEPILQSEVSQKEKHQYSMLLLLLLSGFSRVRLCATL